MALDVAEGLPGAGKTTLLAKHADANLAESERIYEKTKRICPVVSNLFFSSHVEERYGVHPAMKGRTFTIVGEDGECYDHVVHDKYVRKSGLIAYWLDPMDLMPWRNCNVIWDEMGVDLDATQWETLPRVFRKWFQQHRKRGINIVGSAQDFGQIDKSVRRVVRSVTRCTNIRSCDTPSAGRPDIKYVWGLVMLRTCAGREWRDDTQAGVQIPWAFPPGFMFITKELVDLFDTNQPVGQQRKPRVQHLEDRCSCGKLEVKHKWVI